MTNTGATPQFPALFENANNKQHVLCGRGSFLVGRSNDADLPVFDVACSRQQFRIVQRDGYFVLEPLSEKSPTYCDGLVVHAPVRLEHGAVIQAGASQFRFLESEKSIPSASAASGDAQQTILPSIPLPEAGDRTVFAGPGMSAEKLALQVAIPISGQMLIGRDADRAQIHLPHSQVSRIHAQVFREEQAVVITDLNSANGTFVNSRRIQAATVLKRGDRIDIGPYLMVFDGTSLVPNTRENNVELVCRNLKRVVKDQTSGQPLTLLDDITLVIQPREFVCLLGPSGSGKSTLLSAISARVPADSGQVLINGENLYVGFDAMKQDIAVVPQKDVLHDLLSLQTALSYTAKLRLPPDTTAPEINASISEMLSIVGLLGRQNTRIRHLSGGQIKRASLANEIISKPSLLFLDEVTSGLDEQTDREIMTLFRQLADSGKTVVCVTHSLANVERACNLVVVLATGGRLAFVGTPAEALAYFRIERLGEVYERLAEKSADQWKEAFRQHPMYKKYIQSRLPQENHNDAPPAVRQKPTPGEKFRTFKRQLGFLLTRYCTIQLADKQSLGVIFGQCLLVGLLLAVLFGNLDKVHVPQRAEYAGKILFLMAVSCCWFGCNNAAKEIVKERTIYSRERDVNLLISSYYCSKAILLGAISCFQATILLAIVKTFTHLPGETLGQWILLVTLALAGVSLGLLISAASRTDDMAVTIVPLVLMPQIILAGLIAPVEGVMRLLSGLCITTYWGYGGLASLLPDELSTFLGRNNWSATGAWFAMVVHIAVFVTAAIGVLVVQGAGDQVYGQAIDQWLSLARAKLEETLKGHDLRRSRQSR